jgi:hypothetical protein
MRSAFGTFKILCAFDERQNEEIVKPIKPNVTISFITAIKLPEEFGMLEAIDGKEIISFNNKTWYTIKESTENSLRLTKTNNILTLQSSRATIPFFHFFCQNEQHPKQYYNNNVTFGFSILLVNRETSMSFPIEMEFDVKIMFIVPFNFCFIEYFKISKLRFGESITEESFIEGDLMYQLKHRNLCFPISNYSIFKRNHTNNFFSSISTMKIIFNQPHIIILDRIKNPKPVYTMMRIISQKRCLKYVFNSSDIWTLGFLFGGIESLLRKSKQGFWILSEVIGLIR